MRVRYKNPVKERFLNHSKFNMNPLLLLLLLSPGVIQADPKAKEVIHKMGDVIKYHVAWNDWENW